MGGHDRIYEIYGTFACRTLRAVKQMSAGETEEGLTAAEGSGGSQDRETPTRVDSRNVGEEGAWLWRVLELAGRGTGGFNTPAGAGRARRFLLSLLALQPCPGTDPVAFLI